MICKHGIERCGICHDKSGELWPHLSESSARPTGSVAVPVSELEKLEQSRQQLYDYLTSRLKHVELVELSRITRQIWRIANTRSWYRQQNGPLEPRAD